MELVSQPLLDAVVADCAVAASGGVLCASRDGLLIERRASGEAVRVVADVGGTRTERPTTLAVAGAANPRVWVGFKSGAIRVYQGGASDTSGTCLGECRGHKGSVTCIVLHAKRAYTASADHCVCEWHVDTMRLLRMLPQQRGTVHTMAIAGSTLFTAARTDASIRCWNVAAHATCRASGQLAASPIRSLLHHKATHTLWGGGSDGTLRVWHTSKLNVLATSTPHAGAILSLTAAPNGCVVSAGDDGYVNVYKGASPVCIAAMQCPSVMFALCVGAADDTSVQLWALRRDACVEGLAIHAPADDRRGGGEVESTPTSRRSMTPKRAAGGAVPVTPPSRPRAPSQGQEYMYSDSMTPGTGRRTPRASGQGTSVWKKAQAAGTPGTSMGGRVTPRTPAGHVRGAPVAVPPPAGVDDVSMTASPAPGSSKKKSAPSARAAELADLHEENRLLRRQFLQSQAELAQEKRHHGTELKMHQQREALLSETLHKTAECVGDLVGYVRRLSNAYPAMKYEWKGLLQMVMAANKTLLEYKTPGRAVPSARQYRSPARLGRPGSVSPSPRRTTPRSVLHSDCHLPIDLLEDDGTYCARSLDAHHHTTTTSPPALTPSAATSTVHVRLYDTTTPASVIADLVADALCLPRGHVVGRADPSASLIDLSFPFAADADAPKALIARCRSTDDTLAQDLGIISATGAWEAVPDAAVLVTRHPAGAFGGSANSALADEAYVHALAAEMRLPAHSVRIANARGADERSDVVKVVFTGGEAYAREFVARCRNRDDGLSRAYGVADVEGLWQGGRSSTPVLTGSAAQLVHVRLVDTTTPPQPSAIARRVADAMCLPRDDVAGVVGVDASAASIQLSFRSGAGADRSQEFVARCRSSDDPLARDLGIASAAGAASVVRVARRRTGSRAAVPDAAFVRALAQEMRLPADGVRVADFTTGVGGSEEDADKISDEVDVVFDCGERYAREFVARCRNADDELVGACGVREVRGVWEEAAVDVEDSAVYAPLTVPLARSVRVKLARGSQPRRPSEVARIVAEAMCLPQDEVTGRAGVADADASTLNVLLLFATGAEHTQEFIERCRYTDDPMARDLGVVSAEDAGALVLVARCPPDAPAAGAHATVPDEAYVRALAAEMRLPADGVRIATDTIAHEDKEAVSDVVELVFGCGERYAREFVARCRNKDDDLSDVYGVADVCGAWEMEAEPSVGGDVSVKAIEVKLVETLTPPEPSVIASRVAEAMCLRRDDVAGYSILADASGTSIQLSFRSGAGADCSQEFIVRCRSVEDPLPRELGIVGAEDAGALVRVTRGQTGSMAGVPHTAYVKWLAEEMRLPTDSVRVLRTENNTTTGKDSVNEADKASDTVEVVFDCGERYAREFVARCRNKDDDLARAWCVAEARGAWEDTVTEPERRPFIRAGSAPNIRVRFASGSTPVRPAAVAKRVADAMQLPPEEVTGYADGADASMTSVQLSFRSGAGTAADRSQEFIARCHDARDEMVADLGIVGAEAPDSIVYVTRRPASDAAAGVHATAPHDVYVRALAAEMRLPSEGLQAAGAAAGAARGGEDRPDIVDVVFKCGGRYAREFVARCRYEDDPLALKCGIVEARGAWEVEDATPTRPPPRVASAPTLRVRFADTSTPPLPAAIVQRVAHAMCIPKEEVTGCATSADASGTSIQLSFRSGAGADCSQEFVTRCRSIDDPLARELGIAGVEDAGAVVRVTRAGCKAGVPDESFARALAAEMQLPVGALQVVGTSAGSEPSEVVEVAFTCGERYAREFVARCRRANSDLAREYNITAVRGAWEVDASTSMQSLSRLIAHEQSVVNVDLADTTTPPEALATRVASAMCLRRDLVTADASAGSIQVTFNAGAAADHSQEFVARCRSSDDPLSRELGIVSVEDAGAVVHVAREQTGVPDEAFMRAVAADMRLPAQAVRLAGGAAGAAVDAVAIAFPCGRRYARELVARCRDPHDDLARKHGIADAHGAWEVDASTSARSLAALVTSEQHIVNVRLAQTTSPPLPPAAIAKRVARAMCLPQDEVAGRAADASSTSIQLSFQSGAGRSQEFVARCRSANDDMVRELGIVGAEMTWEVEARSATSAEVESPVARAAAEPEAGAAMHTAVLLSPSTTRGILKTVSSLPIDRLEDDATYQARSLAANQPPPALHAAEVTTVHVKLADGASVADPAAVAERIASALHLSHGDVVGHPVGADASSSAVQLAFASGAPAAAAAAFITRCRTADDTLAGDLGLVVAEDANTLVHVTRRHTTGFGIVPDTAFVCALAEEMRLPAEGVRVAGPAAGAGGDSRVSSEIELVFDCGERYAREFAVRCRNKEDELAGELGLASADRIAGEAKAVVRVLQEPVGSRAGMSDKALADAVAEKMRLPADSVRAVRKEQERAGGKTADSDNISDEVDVVFDCGERYAREFVARCWNVDDELAGACGVRKARGAWEKGVDDAPAAATAVVSAATETVYVRLGRTTAPLAVAQRVAKAMRLTPDEVCGRPGTAEGAVQLSFPGGSERAQEFVARCRQAVDPLATDLGVVSVRGAWEAGEAPPAPIIRVQLAASTTAPHEPPTVVARRVADAMCLRPDAVVPLAPHPQAGVGSNATGTLYLSFASSPSHSGEFVARCHSADDPLTNDLGIVSAEDVHSLVRVSRRTTSRLTDDAFVRALAAEMRLPAGGVRVIGGGPPPDAAADGADVFSVEVAFACGPRYAREFVARCRSGVDAMCSKHGVVEAVGVWEVLGGAGSGVLAQMPQTPPSRPARGIDEEGQTHQRGGSPSGGWSVIQGVGSMQDAAQQQDSGAAAAQGPYATYAGVVLQSPAPLRPEDEYLLGIDSPPRLRDAVNEETTRNSILRARFHSDHDAQHGTPCGAHPPQTPGQALSQYRLCEPPLGLGAPGSTPHGPTPTPTAPEVSGRYVVDVNTRSVTPLSAVPYSMRPQLTADKSLPRSASPAARAHLGAGAGGDVAVSLMSDSYVSVSPARAQQSRHVSPRRPRTSTPPLVGSGP